MVTIIVAIFIVNKEVIYFIIIKCGIPLKIMH